ncbi:MAG: hypothetical protein E7Z62_02795 [Thermoplasmata archaeon]|nr:hypothetical protein [Thermoplasmata archaeon]MBR4243953.1 hypothetical protein [Candidatus Methanomethylophilaceae archaeon]
MAFTIRLCPYCGGAITSDEFGYYICGECEKRTFRSRSNSKAYLLNKPYEDEFSSIVSLIERDPSEAISKVEEMMNESEEPTADMYFTRGFAFAADGEEGKAHNDWKKGLDLITDFRFIDAYIVGVCKRIVDLIIMKEREFIQFNPIEYIDLISTEFGVKASVPCKGIFYITVYRNFRMKYQAGELDGDDDIYPTIIPKLLNKILSYGRDFRTVNTIIEEVLEDFHYNPDTYVEDDNLKLHMCSLLKSTYERLSVNFSDEHITRIFRHWNDSNMFDLEYWMDELMKSVRDDTILQKLRSLGSPNREEFDLSTAVEDYARMFLLLSEDGKDLSQDV